VENENLIHLVDQDPVYRDVIEVERELKELSLRRQHADLQAAYEEYIQLLEKYSFWETLNKT